MDELNRIQLISKLEKIFNKSVYAFIYNPGDEEGIRQGDQKYFAYFIETILKKDGIPLDCSIIFSGRGGNLQTAVLCSELLRKNLRRYEVFVPTVAGSALYYFILQSDKLLLGKDSKITQMDPMFEYEGEDLRAIKHLSDPNLSKVALAKSNFNPVFENLNKLMITPPHVFEDHIFKESRLKTYHQVKMVDFWMGKQLHESGISIDELKILGVKLKVIDESTIEKAKQLVNECLWELMEEDKRFMIQTGKAENEYLGGYFFP